jgi:hypothetical protein
MQVAGQAGPARCSDIRSVDPAAASRSGDVRAEISPARQVPWQHQRDGKEQSRTTRALHRRLLPQAAAELQELIASSPQLLERLQRLRLAQ